jgi:hypothetical protein
MDDVVDLEELRRAATGDLTAAVGAAVHEAANARRDGLRGRGELAVHVGVADVLPVAESGLDLVRLERQLAAGPVAGAAAALLADGDGDLIRGSPRVARTAERVVREHADRLVVVERVPDVELDPFSRLAKRGQRVARDLERSTWSFSVGSAGSPGRSPDFRPETMSSTSRIDFPRAAAIHSASVAGTATRVSSRTADQHSSPLASASFIAGSAAIASATRSLSLASRGP